MYVTFIPVHWNHFLALQHMRKSIIWHAFISFITKLSRNDNVEMNRVYSCSAWEIASEMKWKEICGSAETKRKTVKVTNEKNVILCPSPQGKNICHGFVFYKLEVSAIIANYVLL